MITIKSLGCDEFRFIASNITNENKRVIVVAHKGEECTHLVCSLELSNKIRFGKPSVIKKLWNTPIGNGLELEAY